MKIFYKMKYIKLFENYATENALLILEKKIEVGDDLLRKLNKINKPLANKFKQFLNSNDIKDTAKISKIEHSDEDGKMFTIIDDKGQERKFKFGKLLTYLGFDTSSVKQYEVDDFLMNFKKADVNNLKEITGEDILKAYLCDNYDDAKGHGGGLYSSCMRFNKSQEYLKIYTNNPKQVSCLVLTNPSNKRVQGRALIWTMDNGQRFMDRTYVLSKEMNAIFYKYADDNNILKDTPNSDVTLENGGEYDHYPYMDTFIYYTPENGELSTANGDITLQSTGGGHSDDNMIWSDYYNEEVSRDEVVWIESLDTYVFEHDAVEVYGGRDEKNGGFKPLKWILDNADVNEIKYTSAEFEDFEGLSAHIDDTVEIENSGDHILSDDMDIWNDNGWGVFLNNDAFDSDVFDDIDDVSIFAINVTYEKSDHYETYIPMEDACSIWSYDQEKFLIIHNDDMDDFDEDNNGEEYDTIYTTNMQEMTERVYIPKKYINEKSDITKDAPFYRDFKTKAIDIKSNNYNVEIHDGIYLTNTTCSKICIETKNGYRIFPPIFKHHAYHHYDDFLKKYKEWEKTKADKNNNIYFIKSAQKGELFENELIKILEDTKYYTLDDFHISNFGYLIMNKEEHENLSQEVVKLEKHLKNMFGSNKTHLEDNNVSFFGSYYKHDDIKIFPYIYDIDNDKYTIYKGGEYKFYSMSEIYDMIAHPKLFKNKNENMKHVKQFESFKVENINEKLKTAHIKFENPEYNYSTSVNGDLSDEKIKKYFIGTTFDLGNYPNEDMQTCIDCEVEDKLDENSLLTPYQADLVKRTDDTHSETLIGEVDGFKLMYQTWSKIMGGNGIDGTIRTVPQNYYVATINGNGDITFEDLESNTRNINKAKVEKLYNGIRK